MVKLDVITIPPGATIFLDSLNTLKITPASVDVLPGQHTYLLRLEGYADISGAFQAVSGYEYILNAVLQDLSQIEETKYSKQYAQVGWLTLGITIAGSVIGYLIYKKK